MAEQKKVAVVMGSDSDFPVIKPCLELLSTFGVPFDVRVISAHRTPREASDFAENAQNDGVGVIIAAAGKAAHLAGVLAAHTTLPVIGIPVKSPALGGLDALLSTVQMPKGVPVATVAIDGAENAALLSVQMLAIYDINLRDKLTAHKQGMRDDVAKRDSRIRHESSSYSRK